MTNVFKVYQSGLQAFEKENFAEAIELLEAYCQQGANSQSLEYDRACKTLVKAYQAVQEIDKAIALCQELTQSKKPQVRFWAQRWLEQLSAQQEIIGSGTKNTDATNQLPTNGSQPDLEKEHRQPQPSLTPEQANRLLIEGRNALRSKQYPQAIQALEQFSQGVDALHPEYYQVQMWLATAYQQNHQLQAALALGQKLATIENPTIQAWTTQFLQSLSVLIATETVSQIASSQTVVSTRKENPPSSRKNTPESAESGFKLQNLSEFKSFCRNTLKSDLQEFEKKRQSALQALIVVGTIICVVLTVAMTLAPKVLGAISLYQSIIPENICQEFEQLPSEKQEEYVASISEGQLSVSEFSIGCQKSQFSFNNLQSFLLIFAVFLIIFVGCLWSWAIFYSVQTEMYERGFKSRVIEKIIDFINNNQGLNYSTYGDDYSTRIAILNSQLFPSLGSTFSLSQDDCVFGNIGQSKIFFSEVDAKHEIHHGFLSDLIIFLLRRRSFLQILSLFILVIFLTLSLLKAAPYIIGRMIRGQRFDYDEFKEEVTNQVTKRQVFKGLFFRSDFNKNFQGQTFIYPSSMTSNIKLLNQGKGNLVKLEDPWFNELFTVYGSDQIEARYILSTSLMDRLVKFRQKAQRKISIAFCENQIYIAIEYQEDLFEAKLFKTMLDFRPMQEYFENFQLLIGIVEDLNLNRRIWTR